VFIAQVDGPGDKSKTFAHTVCFGSVRDYDRCSSAVDDALEAFNVASVVRLHRLHRARILVEPRG
jgi:hypothetical protein